MSFKDRIRKGVVWASAGLKQTTQYASVLNSMGNTPGVHNYVSGGIGLLNVGMEHLKSRVFDISKLQEFTFLAGVAKDSIDELVIRYACPIGHGSIDNTTSFDVFGAVLHIFAAHSAIYCGKELNVNTVKANLARLVWDNSDGVVSFFPESDYYPKMWKLQLNDESPVFSSDYANAIINSVELYKEKCKNRSFLLYGFPGSGKTCIAYSVARKVGQRTLVIGCATGMAPSVIQDVIKDLNPTTVILNEIDKVSLHSGSLLEVLEFLGKNVPVVIGTANYVDLMPGAFLRPGRFDEIINVDKIDDLMFKNIVDFPCPNDIMNEIKNWPVVFVSELKNRYEITPNLLREHFESLKIRVELNNKLLVKPK